MHETNRTDNRRAGRPRKQRNCRRYKADRVYKPQGIPMREVENVLVDLDEFEAMRLCDHEGLEQVEAGETMGVSRGTVQRLLYKGRKKVIDALLNRHALIINLDRSEEEHDTMHSDQRRSRSRRRRQ